MVGGCPPPCARCQPEVSSWVGVGALGGVSGARGGFWVAASQAQGPGKEGTEIRMPAVGDFGMYTFFLGPAQKKESGPLLCEKRP